MALRGAHGGAAFAPLAEAAPAPYIYTVEQSDPGALSRDLEAIPAGRVRLKGDVMKALVIAVMQSMTVANAAAAKARDVRANAR